MRPIHRRNEKRVPGFVKFFITVAALAGASFCLAFAWQAAETKHIADEAALAAELKPHSYASAQIASSSGVSSSLVSSVAAPKPPANIKTASEAAKDAATQSGKPAPAEEIDYARPLADGAVPHSESVDYAWFDDAIFFGDSISTGIPLYMKATIPGVEVVAAQGVSPEGANSAAVIKSGDIRLTFLEAAAQAGTRAKVYVMLGANAIDLPQEPFINGYRDFVKNLKATYPEAYIYVQSMLPVTRNVRQNYKSKNINNRRITEYNAAIREMAISEGVLYVDVSQCMEDAEGFLPDEASPFDGMHLTPEYYVKWFDYLRSHTGKLEA